MKMQNTVRAHTLIAVMVLQLAAHLQEHASSASALPGVHSLTAVSLPWTHVPALILGSSWRTTRRLWPCLERL